MGLTIFLAWLLFYFYFIALPEFEFAYDPDRWSQVTFSFFTTHYFEFLITPYKMNFIEGTNPGAFSNIIFIFSRIVIGFLFIRLLQLSENSARNKCFLQKIDNQSIKYGTSCALA